MKSIEEQKKDWKREWIEEHALLDCLLIPFSQSIKYDYTIPDGVYLIRRIKNCLERVKISKKLKEEIHAAITPPYSDEYDKLTYYLHSCHHIFGGEFHYGLGTLYRWRWGERDKAISRMAMIYGPNTRKFNEIIKFQDALRLNIPEKIEEFSLSKLMDVFE